MTSLKQASSLSSADIRKLRDAGILKPDEIALIQGDLLIRECVITGTREIISDLPTGLLLEAKRQVLRD